MKVADAVKVVVDDASETSRFLEFFYRERLVGVLALPREIGALFERALKHGARSIQQPFLVEFRDKVARDARR